MKKRAITSKPPQGGLFGDALDNTPATVFVDAGFTTRDQFLLAHWPRSSQLPLDKSVAALLQAEGQRPDEHGVTPHQLAQQMMTMAWMHTSQFWHFNMLRGAFTILRLINAKPTDKPSERAVKPTVVIHSPSVLTARRRATK